MLKQQSYKNNLKSPVGNLVITTTDTNIISIKWGNTKNNDDTALLWIFKTQLAQYFCGMREDFKIIPYYFNGSDHQNKVWLAIMTIPYGETRTYGQIAEMIGSSPLAVGTACGKNPLPIFIPCHRVVPVNDIGKYSGGKGTETKKYLLNLERK